MLGAAPGYFGAEGLGAALGLLVSAATGTGFLPALAGALALGLLCEKGVAPAWAAPMVGAAAGLFGLAEWVIRRRARGSLRPSRLSK
jgi:hypothetical protein